MNTKWIAISILFTIILAFAVSAQELNTYEDTEVKFVYPTDWSIEMFNGTPFLYSPERTEFLDYTPRELGECFTAAKGDLPEIINAFVREGDAYGNINRIISADILQVNGLQLISLQGMVQDHASGLESKIDIVSIEDGDRIFQFEHLTYPNKQYSRDVLEQAINSFVIKNSHKSYCTQHLAKPPEINTKSSKRDIPEMMGKLIATLLFIALGTLLGRNLSRKMMSKKATQRLEKLEKKWANQKNK